MRWRYSKYNLTQGVQRLKTKTAIVISAVGLVFGSGAGLALVTLGAAHADSNYTLFGNAAVQADGVHLTSNGSSYSGISFNLPSGTTVADLNNLDLTYSVVTGHCGGGSPRFSVDLPGNKSVFVYVGDAPNFNSCSGGTTGNLLSTADLRVDTSQVGGSFYDNWAHATSLVGSQTVGGLDLVVDGGWLVNQEFVVSSATVNSTTTHFGCYTVNTSKGNMTAAQVGGNVSGELNATGCQIGVYYNGGTGTVSGADIHGATYYGVFADRGAAVNVTDSDVHQIGDTPFSGAQHGVAVFYTLGSTGTVSSNTIDNYQKNGMAITEPDTNVAVSDNTVTGNGAVPNIAQNGIEFGYGAMGSARGNTINGNWYTGATWSSTGLLLFDVSANQVKTSNNTFSNNQKNLAVITAQACPHQYGGFYEQYGLCTYQP